MSQVVAHAHNQGVVPHVGISEQNLHYLLKVQNAVLTEFVGFGLTAQVFPYVRVEVISKPPNCSQQHKVNQFIICEKISGEITRRLFGSSLKFHSVIIQTSLILSLSSSGFGLRQLHGMFWKRLFFRQFPLTDRWNQVIWQIIRIRRIFSLRSRWLRSRHAPLTIWLIRFGMRKVFWSNIWKRNALWTLWWTRLGLCRVIWWLWLKRSNFLWTLWCSGVEVREMVLLFGFLRCFNTVRWHFLHKDQIISLLGDV